MIALRLATLDDLEAIHDIRRDAILATHDASIWSRERQDAVDKGTGLECLGAIWSFIQIN